MINVPKLTTNTHAPGSLTPGEKVRLRACTTRRCELGATSRGVADLGLPLAAHARFGDVLQGPLYRRKTVRNQGVTGTEQRASLLVSGVDGSPPAPSEGCDSEVESAGFSASAGATSLAAARRGIGIVRP